MNGIHQIAGSILGIPLQCFVGIEKENVHGRRGFFGTGHIIVQSFIQIIVESGTVVERCNENSRKRSEFQHPGKHPAEIAPLLADRHGIAPQYIP